MAYVSLLLESIYFDIDVIGTDPYRTTFHADATAQPTRLGALLVRFLDRKGEEPGRIERSRDQTVNAATLPELINVLTDEREYFGHYMTDLADSFFLFFRSFASPALVMNLFIKRYNESVPTGLSELQLTVWYVHHRLVKIHIVRLLDLWLEYHWKEDTDSALVDVISKFQFGTLCKDKDIPVECTMQIAQHLTDCSTGHNGRYGRWLQSEVTRTEKAAEPWLPTKFQRQLDAWAKLQPFNPFVVIRINAFCQKDGSTELARLLTCIESNFFHSFLPEDLIKFDHGELQQKLRAWTDFSNSLTIWTIKCILDQTDVTARASMVELFTSVAFVSTF